MPIKRVTSVRTSLCRGLLICCTAFVCNFSLAAERDRVTAEIKYDAVGDGYEMYVTNNTKDVVCIADDVFDTRRGYLALFDENGAGVAQFSYADAAPHSGFNYDRPYYFIPPAKTLIVGVNMRNFRVVRKEYRYEFTYSYVVCSDVSNPRRGRVPSDIRGGAAVAAGEWLYQFSK